MSDRTETICFTCGLPTGEGPGEMPRLNTLPSGTPCPTCRDRLLESLPGIFPGGQPTEGEVEMAEEADESLPSTVLWGSRDPDEPA